jgi:uncharacterized protein YgiM (DUF1202 family)
VKALAALLLALAAIDEGRAATAYVTDELVLGVYAAPTTQGQRLATLHSGATVEALSTTGDATQVRLLDGTTGWVKTAYLTTTEPATVRLKLLQDELDRSRATGPGLAEAAARAEVERLKRELAQRPAPPAPADAGAAVIGSMPTWAWASAVIGALACGFWLGYATLARRIKYKFGGIKVY